jgi:hypothetical protein
MRTSYGLAAELKRTPDLSDNWLAQILGTTDKTVAAVRQELIATSEIPKLDALRGKDGKYRRVTRITTNTAKEAERAQQALQILGDDAPCRDLDLRHNKRGPFLRTPDPFGRRSDSPSIPAS